MTGAATAQSAQQRVLLTGATGFIGAHVLHALLERGAHVTTLARNPAALSATHVNLHSLHCELTTRGLQSQPVIDAIERADAIIHAAGSVRGADRAAFRPANIEAVQALANAAASRSVSPPFLLLSSLAATQPGLSDYAWSKHQGEQQLQSADIPWTIMRPTAVYGPGDRELRATLSTLRRGLTLIPGNAAQRLSFIHVDDLSRAILAWLEHTERCAERAYNLDDGKPDGYTWTEITAAASAGRILGTITVPTRALSAVAHANQTISRLLGYAPMLTPGKVRELTHTCWLGENGPFTRDTGWQPKQNLQQGIAALFSAP